MEYIILGAWVLLGFVNLVVLNLLMEDGWEKEEITKGLGVIGIFSLAPLASIAIIFMGLAKLAPIVAEKLKQKVRKKYLI